MNLAAIFNPDIKSDLTNNFNIYSSMLMSKDLFSLFLPNFRSDKQKYFGNYQNLVNDFLDTFRPEIRQIYQGYDFFLILDLTGRMTRLKIEGNDYVLEEIEINQQIKKFIYDNYSTLFLTEDGQVYQVKRSLKDNSVFNLDIETFKSGELIEGVDDIVAGKEFYYLLTNDGLVYGFGQNKSVTYFSTNYGMITPEKIEKIDQPIIIEIPLYRDEKVVSIKAGNDHGLFLTDKGRVFVLGDDSSGQLGTSERDYSPLSLFIERPRLLQIDNEIVKIATGLYHSLLLARDGTVYSSGINEWGSSRIFPCCQEITAPDRKNPAAIL